MSYSLEAVGRTLLGKKNKSLRADNFIPGVVYGHGEINRLVAVRRGQFEKLFMAAGESTLIDLSIDEAPVLKVLIHDVQRHSITGNIFHVDFYQVKMTEKLTTDVPLIFNGESKAVKELGGVLVKTLDHLKIECLPQDLVHELSVDLGSLNTFDDAIYVRDLALPASLRVLMHGDDVVVKVQPPRLEEEVKIEAEGAAAEAPTEVPVAGREEEKKEASSTSGS